MKKLFLLLMLPFWVWSMVLVPFSPESDTVKISTIQRSQGIFFNAQQLAQELELQNIWYPLRRKLQLKSIYSQREAYITEENPYVLLDNQVLRIKDQAIWHRDSLYIPAEAFFLYSELADCLLRPRSASQLICEPKGGIRHFSLETRENGTIVNLTIPPGIHLEHWHHEPHFILRLNNFKADTALFSRVKAAGLIRRILPIQEENSLQITFETTPQCERVEVLKKNGGTEIQFIFRKKQPQKTVEPPPAVQRTIRRVVIDAGHGGRDPGALGANSQEKEITLKVALELEKILKKEGFEPLLTRRTDTFLELRERPKMASDWNGDLFISLHCNAIDGDERRRKRTKGFKVFILREATSEEDKAIARRENAAVQSHSDKSNKHEISPVEWILLEHQLNLYTKESERFAEHIVKAMDGQTPIEKLGYGAGQAGFFVLMGAFMPAVLYEMGFITNPEEEKYMNTARGQREIARKLADAVISYRNEVER
jgi:N-acetylmuramoyl-L-alanine amidase